MRRIEAACGCDMGKVRGNNEDAFFFDGVTPDRLGRMDTGLQGQVLTCAGPLLLPRWFGVFDGMGGEAFGEEAAALAARTTARYARWGRRDLVRLIEEANEAVCAASYAHGGQRLGSTVVLLRFSAGEAALANVGDSRAFLWRRGEMSQISVDHTDRDLLAQCAAPKGRKPRLTQHLGLEPDEVVLEPYVARIPLQGEDRFLLCSDGLTDMVPEDQICRVLGAAESAEAAVRTLLSQALDNGGRDNVTIIVCIVH